MRTVRRSPLIAVAIALLFAAAGAAGSEATPASYREAVEPICKLNTQANQRTFKGVRTLVRQGELKLAARRFIRAAAALRDALAELRAVPQPAADQARLARWLRDIGSEASLLEAVARKLRQGNKAAAQALVVRLAHNARIANGLVVAFEFHYCRLEPSRFL